MEREPDYNPYPKDDSRLIGWLKEARDEGNKINKEDPAYDKMDPAMDYIIGNQHPGQRPSYVEAMIVNRTRKAVLSHVSALTDVRPLFRYKSSNPNWASSLDILNKLITVWWVNTFSDIALGDCAKYALACGSGDMVIEWDPHFHGPDLGDTRLIARDPRDTIPFRPTRDHSIQQWAGVTIQEAISPNALYGKYPELKGRLTPRESWVKNIFTRFKRGIGVVSPVMDLTAGVKSRPSARGVPEITFNRTFLRDPSINETLSPVLVGIPGRGWAYMVEPGKPLYPNGRLILWVEDGVIYDGPNPYQHGKYPVTRMTLQAWPWSFFGMGLVHDLMPMQDAINRCVNDFFSTFAQWVGRSVVADKNSVPDAMLKRFDPRKPLNKMRLNAAFGEGFKLLDGPTLPPWSLDFLNWLVMQFDDLAGFANLQAMAQLRQMPSADTIQAYAEALTPELRLEGRQQERFLRESADMILSNFLQYYSKERRLTMLGDAGIVLEDFDYDPETLIPAMNPGDAGYIPELDASKSRNARARFFKQHISFEPAEASLLAMNALKEKMLYLQFARMGYVDFWTVMEKFEVPNVGQPPAIVVPDTQSPITYDPATGAPMPPPFIQKVPATITERLQAQMMMGIGMTESPAGRKASGQQAPHVEQREGGRTTIAES